MEREKLERLIAMLDPSASEESVKFVIDEIMKVMPQPKAPAVRRTAQQNVDPYDSSIANDPRFW